MSKNLDMSEFDRFMSWYNSQGGNLAEFDQSDLCYLYSEYKVHSNMRQDSTLKFIDWCFFYWERYVK